MEYDRRHTHDAVWGVSPAFVTSLIWALLDLVTVAIATVLALRCRIHVPSDIAILWQPVYLMHRSSPYLLMYIAWFGILLVGLGRSYGLYEPLLGRSGLHEQRMTVQAALTSGLLLCGTLYLARAEMVSRIVVVLTVIFATGILCIRQLSGAGCCTAGIAKACRRATC